MDELFHPGCQADQLNQPENKRMVRVAVYTSLEVTAETEQEG